MSKEQASLHKHLRARVRALGTVAPRNQRGRIIYEGTDGSAFAAILQEIDETVLRRELTFEADEATIVCEVADRRLRRIVMFDAPDAPDAQSDWATSLDMGDASRVSDWLAAVCQSMTRVFVRSSLCATRGDGVTIGLAIPALREASPIPSISFEDAVGQTMPLVACILSENGIEPLAADDHYSGLLIAARDEKSRMPDIDSKVFVARQVNDTVSTWVAVANQDDKAIWFAFDASTLPELLVIWAQVDPTT